MSIIHDALKKVQETAQRKSGSTQGQPVAARDERSAPVQASTTLPSTGPGRSLSFNPARSILIALTILLMIVLFLAKDSILKPTTAAKTEAKTASAQLPAAPAVPSKPAAAPVEPKPQTNPNDPLSSLRVEGIIDLNGKKAALINGNIYEEGQTILGKNIIGISMDGVTIMNNGEKRILQVNPSRR